ncbi:MAG: right-handed parallel beta-helix repeat-containing protein, partial [Gammaproteobacteria bacterium]|nr:right-handed parallel beta-helix repeat-containing protein [Gammaproteobacteria bacterium]
ADRPMGFCSVLPAVSGEIRDLTIENIETSVYWAYGRIDIKNCRMAGSGYGFVGLAAWAEGGNISNCRFETSVGGKGCFLPTASDVVISNCEFIGWGGGVSAVSGARNIVIESCAFDRSVRAVAFSWQSSGSVRDCQMTRMQEFGIYLYDRCDVEVARVSMDSWNRGLYVVASKLTGTDIVIENTGVESLLACCNSIITISNSQFIPRAGLAVRCEARWNTPSTLDLSGNYWGTTDPQAIRDLIWDGNDQPNINCTVQFEPFLGGPLPTESVSWGGVKVLFR